MRIKHKLSLNAAIEAARAGEQGRATQVAAAVEEQSSVSGEVGQNIVVIRDITEATSEGVQRNARASEEISCQASELQQAVAVFKV